MKDQATKTRLLEQVEMKFLMQQINQEGRNYSVVLKNADTPSPQWISVFSCELTCHEPQINQVIIGLADTQVERLKVEQLSSSREFFPRQDYAVGDTRILNVPAIEDILRKSVAAHKETICILNDTSEAYDLEDAREFTGLRLVGAELKALADELRIPLVQVLPTQLYPVDRSFGIGDVQRLRNDTLPIIGVSHFIDIKSNTELLRVLRMPNQEELLEQPFRHEFFGYHLVRDYQIIKRMISKK